MSDDETGYGDEKRKKRGEALRGRLAKPSQSSEASEPSKASKTVETDGDSETTASETVMSSEELKTPETSEASKTATRNRKNVNMYLPEALIDDVDLVRDELNLQLKRAGEEPFEKNKHYRALVLALGVDALREMDADEARAALRNDDRLDDPP